MKSSGRRRFNTISSARGSIRLPTPLRPPPTPSFHRPFAQRSGVLDFIVQVPRCHALPCTVYRIDGVCGGGKGCQGLCRRPRGRSLAAAQGGSRNSCSKASRAHGGENERTRARNERKLDKEVEYTPLDVELIHV